MRVLRCLLLQRTGVYDEIVAEDRFCRLDLQVQTKDSSGGWRSVGSTELTPGNHSWRRHLRKGAQQLQDLHVRAGDAHYDAKLFPIVHPYGSGSVRSEFGSGGHQKLVRSRAMSIQSWFRRSSMWCFFQLDLAIKNALFFGQIARRRCGKATTNADKFTQTYGNIVPSHIPDSTAWWRRQSKELAAICDDAECGLMQAMAQWHPSGSLGTCFHKQDVTLDRW